MKCHSTVCFNSDLYRNISLSEIRMSVHEECLYMEYHFCSPSLGGGIPLVLLLDTLGCLGVLGVLGVEFSFCIEGGTVGMASTVLVVWLLRTAGCWSTGDSCGISGSPVVSWESVETEFWLLCLGLMKLLFLLKHCPVAGISTM